MSTIDGCERDRACETGREAAWERGRENVSGAGLVLCLALAIGLLRFWRLGEWSLWIDEALTWTDYYVGIEGGEIQNPLGYHLVHWTVGVFGGLPDEFTLRILPAVAGFLAIPATAWAFRPLAGARASALAALFVAASSWQIYWSQNARFYTLAELVTLAGAGLYLRGFARTSLVRAFAGLAVTAAAAAFHPSAALALAPLLVAPWVAARRTREPLATRARILRGAWIVAIVVALAGAAWGHKALELYFIQKGSRDPFELGALLARVAHLAKTTGFYYTPLLGAAALAGAWLAWSRRTHAGVFAACVAACGLGLAAAIAVIGARMSAQYVFVFFPWIALLAALPAVELAAGSRAVPRAWTFVLTAVLLVNTALYFSVRRGERPPWREAYQYVWNRREAGDLVLGMEATVGEFYLAPWRENLRQPEHVQWLDKWRARLPEHWSRHSRRMWLVVNPEQFLDWDPADAADVQRFLREECRLVKCWPLYVESRDLSVWVYVRD